MNVYKDRLLKKSSNRKSKVVLSSLELRWSLHGLQTSHFICDRFGSKLWLQSIQNHAWHRFQAFAPAIWSRWAVRFESEQTPVPRTGRRFRPADLHRIRFGTCGFVPKSYFYSETNVWYKDGAKRWALLSGCFGRQQLLGNSIEIFISHEKKKSLVAA